MKTSALVLVAAAAVLAGCGSATSERAGSSIVPDMPAPAIVAADEAPPDDVASFLKRDFEPPPPPDPSKGASGMVQICLLSDTHAAPATETTACPEPTPEERAKLQAEEERYRQAIEPASGGEPRVVAKLALGRRDVLFTAWTSRSGAVCWETDEEGPDGGGGGGPAGPCTSAVGLGFETPSCTSLCLDSSGGGTGSAAEAYVLSGTVPRDAEALRITLAGGATATYPLVGPALFDTERRIFMLDLGAHDWRKLELIRQGAVAVTVDMPKTQAAYEDCSAKLGPPPMPPASPDTQALLDAMRPYNSALQACVRSAGAVSSVDVAHP